MSNDASIDVLLIDDNEQWANFIARDLERVNEDLTVSVATSANEALQRIQGSDRYNCLVTDYQMPEMNGIQPLERIRDDHPDLPILLLTGEGDENIAAEAISSGANDYLIKDPKSDQTSLLEQRISTAVKQHRLQKSVEESEERYRTVTEQSSDAIVIVQDGRAVFWNQRLSEIVGFEGSNREAFDPVEALIHPDDQSTVRDTIEAWYDDRNAGDLQETRVTTQDGHVRHWELAGRLIAHDDEPAVLISARDVTQQKRQIRELEWEKELNRNIQQALVESRTREDLEEAVCTHLQQYGYPLAWCGHVDGELRPVAIRGDGSYTESVTFTLDDARDGEPAAWAADPKNRSSSTTSLNSKRRSGETPPWMRDSVPVQRSPSFTRTSSTA